jgi:hypothetical protein
MSESQAREMAQGFDLHPAWRRDNSQFEADVIDFWNRLGMLPANVKPEDRAKELVTVAYKDGRIVGVQTAVITRVELVRARLAMLRSLVDPEVRRSRVSFALTLFSRDVLERWALEHPEGRLAGLGAIIESKEFAGREKEPFWPNSKFGVVGYTKDGRQIRVSWFEDFRFD